MEVTLELNDDKWPSLERLARMWAESRAALVDYALAAVFSGGRLGRLPSTACRCLWQGGTCGGTHRLAVLQSHAHDDRLAGLGSAVASLNP